MAVAAQATKRLPSASCTGVGLRGTVNPLRRAVPAQRILAGRDRLGCVRVRTAYTTCQVTRERDKEAILCQRLKGHSAAVTAALVLNKAGGVKELITSSLDKTLVLWRLQQTQTDAELSFAECEELTPAIRLKPEGSPIFSLVQDGYALGENHNQIFCGNHSKSIVAWEPPETQLEDKVILNGHTGWVRALATQGRWLFSSGCSILRQWDMARAVPRLVRNITLPKGDILSLATGGGRVFSAGADGSIRAWLVQKKDGTLTPSASRDKAHSDRVTAVVFRDGFLYSTSYDGSVKMWDAASMELVMSQPAAHGGARVLCCTPGPDGYLYTGGDDKLIRRWRLGALTPAEGIADALYCHNYSVRALASGAGDMLISGDAGGEIAVWKI